MRRSANKQGTKVIVETKIMQTESTIGNKFGSFQVFTQKKRPLMSHKERRKTAQTVQERFQQQADNTEVLCYHVQQDS